MPSEVFLIRHGQSAFNAAVDEIKQAIPHTPEAELRERFDALRRNHALRDARLSPAGERQVADASVQAQALGVDVVIMSPLTRAIQTAMGLFGTTAARTEVSHLHAERLFSICDVGRSPTALSVDFPHIDFTHLHDVWWHCADSTQPSDAFLDMEPEETFQQRVNEFRNSLRARPEARIAVVGHGLFFEAVCGRHLENCEIAPFSL